MGVFFLEDFIMADEVFFERDFFWLNACGLCEVFWEDDLIAEEIERV
jgi:hypothetical protein